MMLICGGWLKLEQVFIAGDDHDIHAALHGLARDGADHVVGLVAWILERGHAHGLEEPLGHRNLLEQLGWRFTAVGLVGGEFLLAQRLAFALEHRGKIVGLMHGTELFEHRVEDEHHFGGRSLRRAHGWSAGTGTRVKRPEKIAESVDQE